MKYFTKKIDQSDEKYIDKLFFNMSLDDKKCAVALSLYYQAKEGKKTLTQCADILG